MSKPVLLVQSNPSAAKDLYDYLVKRGDKVWMAADTQEAAGLLEQVQPEVIFLDLLLPNGSFHSFVRILKEEHPHKKIIVTHTHPDLRREMLAQSQGLRVLLRSPFQPRWIERALARVEQQPGQESDTKLPDGLPKVRVPIRVKITYPYAILAVFLTLAVAFLISRFVLESMEERFANQLRDSAVLSADWMVQEEARILRTLRQMARTEGIAAAIEARDAEKLRTLALPLAANYHLEVVEVLDMQGQGLLSLRKVKDTALDYAAVQGDSAPARLKFIQRVLKGDTDKMGDKFAGVGHPDWGEPVFYIAGPVFNSAGQQVGVIALGQTLSTLAADNRRDTLAHITIYTPEGALMVSTLFIKQDIHPLPENLVNEIYRRQDEASNIRTISSRTNEGTSQPSRSLMVASSSYAELLAPWEARGGDDLGVIGIALAENFQFLPSFSNQVMAFLLLALAFVAVITTGLFLGERVTRPLARVVLASTEVARGNLEIRVPATGNDEVTVLAHAFNHMVSGLQEGFIYRDLLGRSVSPEVRETMRKAFASGELRLEGQNTEATVLLSDISGFTTFSEHHDPATILRWLNEYFSELVPVVTAHGGVIDKFEGDAMLAFFGILPTPLSPHESAYQGCLAATEMLNVIDHINHRRKARGEPVLQTGISLHTGVLTAGGLGTADRLNYTIIGDTVNTTARMQTATRRFKTTGIVTSENTMAAIQEKRLEFEFVPLGEHTFPGKKTALWLYRLLPKPAVQKEDKGVSNVH